MEQLPEQDIHDYLDEIDVLIEEAEKDIENNLLDAIDIDELFQDPEGYLLALGDAFLDRHMKKMTSAFSLGGNHATNMIELL